jgi:SOS-response transcriptional repressor LexA
VTKRLIKAPRPSPVRAREEPATKMPTQAEMEALRAFAKLLEETGRPPSVREVSKEMGLEGNGAQRHLIALSLKGSLEEVKELVVKERKLTPLGRQWLKMPS